MKFMTSEMAGCFHQKALDLQAPPTLPKYVLLYRARGIEKEETVDDDDDEEVDEEESDGDDGVAGKNLDEAMTSHGDL